MHNYTETFETWNKIARLYQDKFMHLELYNDSYDYLIGAINQNNARILDVGCGPGNITKYLLNKQPSFRILGIDIAPNMVELATGNNPTAKFEVMDSRNICDLKYLFNAVVVGFCLPYLIPMDGKRLILNAFHLLDNGGILYLSFVEGEPDQSGIKVGSSGDRVFFNYYPLAEIINECNLVGFILLHVFKVKYPRGNDPDELHTILIAKK